MEGLGGLERDMLKPPKSYVPCNGADQRKQGVELASPIGDGSDYEPCRTTNENTMNSSCLGTTLVVNEPEVQHGCGDNENASDQPNRKRLAPTTREEAKGSKGSSEDGGHDKLEPVHETPNV
jgi:hypothetical protein